MISSVSKNRHDGQTMQKVMEMNGTLKKTHFQITEALGIVVMCSRHEYQ